MQQDKATKPDWLWLALCTAAGLALRLCCFASRPLWYDELVTLITARQPLRQSLLTLQDPQPPLYQAILRLYADLPGHPGEWALRLPSLVAGVLAIPLAWALARAVASRPVAGAAALLVATNPLLVHYSREARPYSLFLMLAVASMLLLWRCLERGRVADLIGLAVVTALLFYTHYYAIFLVAGQCFFVAGDWLLGGPSDRELKKLVAAYAAAFIVAEPGLALFLRLLRLGVPGAYWILPPGPFEAVDAMGDLLGPRLLGPLCLIPLLASVWLARSAMDRQAYEGDWWHRRRAAIFCVCWVAFGLFLPIFVSMVVKPGYVLRYALPVAIPLTILGVRYLKAASPALLWAVVALLVAVNLPEAWSETGRMEGVRAAAFFLNEPANRDQPVLVVDRPFAEGYVYPEAEGLRYYGLGDRAIGLLSVQDLKADGPEVGRTIPPGRSRVVCFAAMINPLLDYLNRHGRGFTVRGFGEYLNVVEISPGSP